MVNKKRDNLVGVVRIGDERNYYEDREPEGGLENVTSFSSKAGRVMQVNRKRGKLVRVERVIRVRNGINICAVKQVKRAKHVIGSPLNHKTRVVTGLKRNSNIRINNIHKLGKVTRINSGKKYRSQIKKNEG